VQSPFLSFFTIDWELARDRALRTPEAEVGRQGCQTGSFAAKFVNLALFQVSWPRDFWVGPLAFLAVFIVVWSKIFLWAVFENNSVF